MGIPDGSYANFNLDIASTTPLVTGDNIYTAKGMYETEPYALEAPFNLHVSLNTSISLVTRAYSSYHTMRATMLSEGSNRTHCKCGYKCGCRRKSK